MCFFFIFLKLVLVVFNLRKTERTSFPLYTPLFDWKYLNNWIYFRSIISFRYRNLFYTSCINIVLVYSETSINFISGPPIKQTPSLKPGPKINVLYFPFTTNSYSADTSIKWMQTLSGHQTELTVGSIGLHPWNMYCSLLIAINHYI